LDQHDDDDDDDDMIAVIRYYCAGLALGTVQVLELRGVGSKS
jgi:hypothetical protein